MLRADSERSVYRPFRHQGPAGDGSHDPPALGGNLPLGSHHLAADYPNLLTAIRREGEWGIGERT
jgi:hypothetical protein